MLKLAASSNIINKTSEAFSRVGLTTGKAAQLIAEITSASQEQAHGIAYVDKAVK